MPGMGIRCTVPYSRGEVRGDSDIDLVIPTGQPQMYLKDASWTEHFGVIEKTQTEDYLHSFFLAA